MTGWVTFDGKVEPIVWGRATYTILRLPPKVVNALGPTRRVDAEIAEHPVNLALTRAPVVDGAFLWTGASLLRRAGIKPGDRVEVRLRPAPDDAVDLDPDIEVALRSADLLVRWHALTPGRRRGLLAQITAARTDATRQKRIARLIKDLP